MTTAETLVRRGRPLWGRAVIGFWRPRRNFKVPHLEYSGEIVETGADVQQFDVGDEVFGFSGFGMGACAEYKRMSATSSLAHKPRNATHREAAAAVDGATTALFFLRERAKLVAGENVLVIGASGSIGTYAVQLAKLFGARVTAVCSGRNAELVETLGADQALDYTSEDFTENDETYDVIFDTVGKSSFNACKSSLSENGRYLSTIGLRNYFLALWTGPSSRKRVVTGMSSDKRTSLPFIRDLIESGQLAIVMDRQYDLSEIEEAHRYVQTGRKRGNVVVMVERDSGEESDPSVADLG
ncbi:NAD(P)-dependent alcohol dehydrogenase [Glycomyces tarimensis]